MWQKYGKSLGTGKAKCHGTKRRCLHLDFLMICAVATSGAEGCAQRHAEQESKLYLTRVLIHLEGHSRHQWDLLENRGCAPMRHLPASFGEWGSHFLLWALSIPLGKAAPAWSMPYGLELPNFWNKCHTPPEIYKCCYRSEKMTNFSSLLVYVGSLSPDSAS